MIVVAFEGVSGSGKSTAIKNISTRLRNDGYVVDVVDTDSGTHGDILKHFAKKLSPENPLRTLIFWIFRFREARKIRNMRQCDVILADRYIGASFVFSLLSGIPSVLCSFFYSVIKPTPDITFFFHISLTEVRKRKLSETNKKEKHLALDILREYKKTAKKFDWTQIDAFQSEEEVSRECLNYILKKLK